MLKDIKSNKSIYLKTALLGGLKGGLKISSDISSGNCD